jgi:DNA repair exonuclease SbcCD ATPase subunit
MIHFKTIRYKNFLSTGNTFTEIYLDKSPNTLIIGSNGAGKSTMLDAITFGLFNKSFRKVNKPDLINSVNEKGCLVEIEFSVGKKSFLIRRGMKPALFEIYENGVLINQDSKSRDMQKMLEGQILGMNYKTFTQVVVLGSSSYVSFMKLTAASRRSVVEDLLDIHIFSAMHTVLKDRIATWKEFADQNNYDANLTREKISIQKKHLQSLREEKKSIIDDKQQQIENTKETIVECGKDIEDLQSKIEDLMESIKDKSDIEQKKIRYLDLESKIKTNMGKIKKELDFFQTNDECPTCLQDIDEDFKETRIDINQKNVDDLNSGLVQLDDQLSKVEDRLDEIDKLNHEIFEYNKAISDKNTRIRFLNEYIEDVKDEIKKLKEKSGADDVQERLTELRDALTVLEKERESLVLERSYYDIASTLLKDSGIKTRIVKQYLPVMNKLINKYLTAMDFFVNFTLDENFNESIKSRYRDSFTYDSFSEGEKFRIDIALLLTWREVAKMRNSVSTNLLILDEVFDSSLDGSGTEDFLKLLHGLNQDTSVWVISHKGDILLDKFTKVIRFEKHGNFSRMEVMS